MYRIRFSPYTSYAYGGDNGKVKKIENWHRVYSDDIDLIYRFLYQHNFDPNASVIENIPREVATSSEDHLSFYELDTMKLWSNDDKKFHEIVTSYELFNKSVDYVTNELAAFLLFGPTILRRDIQVIDLVVNCLETIPCCTILDFDLLDGDSISDTDDWSWKSVKKRMKQIQGEPDWDANDLSSLAELIERECDNDIMPITMEAYVKAFVEYLVKPDMK